jgi:hypothetical protein
MPKTLFLPIHIQNYMPQKGNFKKKKNKFWACSNVVTNGTVLVPNGTLFLEHFFNIFVFFSTRGTSHGLACTFGSVWGARNQPHLPSIDPFTSPTFYKYNIKPPYKRLAGEKEI